MCLKYFASDIGNLGFEIARIFQSHSLTKEIEFVISVQLLSLGLPKFCIFYFEASYNPSK